MIRVNFTTVTLKRKRLEGFRDVINNAFTNCQSRKAKRKENANEKDDFRLHCSNFHSCRRICRKSTHGDVELQREILLPDHKGYKNSHKGEYDLVRVIDANGQIYEFYTDCGDYGKGDAISVIMDTRGTPKVFDDWVVEAKYDRPDLLKF